MSSTNTNTVGKEVEELLSAEPNKTSTIQEELNKQLYPEIGMAAQHTSEKVEENEEEGIHPEDNSTEAIYQELQKHDGEMYTDEAGVTYIEGLCPNCEKNGINRLLMVNIPNFKEIIITSFECPHCNFKNNEVQSGAPIQPQGVKYELVVKGKEDMNRSVIKGDYCTITIPELDFEIPYNTQRGALTTVEGIFTSTVSSLRFNSDYRAEKAPEVAEAVENFCKKLDSLISGEMFPFHFLVDDPSGNSFVENIYLPRKDPSMVVTKYFRTPEQQTFLGLSQEDDEEVKELKREKAAEEQLKQAIAKKEEERKKQKELQKAKEECEKEYAVPEEEDDGAFHIDEELLKEDEPCEKEGGMIKVETKKVHFDSSNTENDKEMMVFRVRCHACGAMGENRMCITDIPYFKEVIIMSFVCDACGFKTNEIKGGGAVPEKGKRIMLHITKDSCEEDIRRDMIKSDTASIFIPELELELEQGSLGGMYTSVEGIINCIKTSLTEGNPILLGDSAEDEKKIKLEAFLTRLDGLVHGVEDWTLDVIDPMANSWIYSPYEHPEQDPRLEIVDYERTYEENELLGLNDMKTEDY